MLRTWRENSERRSKDVVDLWEICLKKHMDDLGNESKLQLLSSLKLSVDNFPFFTQDI